MSTDPTDPDLPPTAPASLDASGDPIAADILKGVVRLLVDMGAMPIAEMTLPNWRRADVAALDRDGRLIIVEIKSSLADFRSDQKWPGYLEFCDRFYFAVRPDFPVAVLPEDTGLILADRFGGEIVRAAGEQAALPAARRKALTLRFARTAALRLAIKLNPMLGPRSEAKDV